MTWLNATYRAYRPGNNAAVLRDHCVIRQAVHECRHLLRVPADPDADIAASVREGGEQVEERDLDKRAWVAVSSTIFRSRGS